MKTKLLKRLRDEVDREYKIKRHIGFGSQNFVITRTYEKDRYLSYYEIAEDIIEEHADLEIAKKRLIEIKREAIMKRISGGLKTKILWN